MRFPSSALLWLPLALLCSACSGGSGSKLKLPTENERYSLVYLESGTEAMYAEKYHQALGDFLEAVRYNPKNLEAWNNMGITYYGLRETKKAKETWEKVLELNPAYSEARNNLGAMLLEQGNLADAEKQLRLVVQDLVFSKSYLAHYNLALIYQRQEKFLLAEQHLMNAVNSNRTYCPAWLKLGQLLVKKGEYLAAAENFRSGTQSTCYNSPETHFELGRALVKAGKVDAARAKFIEIAQNFGQTAWADKAKDELKAIISE